MMLYIDAHLSCDCEVAISFFSISSPAILVVTIAMYVSLSALHIQIQPLSVAAEYYFHCPNLRLSFQVLIQLQFDFSSLTDVLE